MSEKNSNVGFLHIVLASALGYVLAKGCSNGQREQINKLDYVNDRLTTIERKIDHCEERIPQLLLTTTNVTGGPEPEEFYTLEGRRAYVTIDGVLVEDYARSNPARQ
ncbi:MAG: hypothetical protein HY363_04450 [Candidatus Aenigmarchaeota archaeon]|nr:hypothetical protein [Candidatus Aenigmarchaeota archaeon]